MEFVLHKNIFKTPFHFKCFTDTGIFEKVSSYKDDVLVIGDSKESYEISLLYGYTIPIFPSKKYRNSFRDIEVDKDKIPWHLVIPTAEYKKEVLDIIHGAIEFFKHVDLNYYKNIFLPTQEIFSHLQSAKINTNILYGHLYDSNDKQDKSHLKTFIPYNEYTENVTYTRLLSLTGRMKHSGGPRILNIQKQYRDIIVSRFDNDGKVVYLDFSSLEPRVLLSVNGNPNSPQDIYQSLIDELGISVPRKAIKTIILSRIYGSSNATIINNLKDLVQYPNDLIELVDDYFGISALKEKLLEEFNKNNQEKIYNYYGRPILCKDADSYKLLNYYIQSTAVDVALFGFNTIVNRIKKAGLLDKIVPLFLVHDAIIFDIHKDYEHLIEKICKLGSLNIKGFETTNFYLKRE